MGMIIEMGPRESIMDAAYRFPLNKEIPLQKHDAAYLLLLAFESIRTDTPRGSYTDDPIGEAKIPLFDHQMLREAISQQVHEELGGRDAKLRKIREGDHPLGALQFLGTRLANTRRIDVSLPKMHLISAPLTLAYRPPRGTVYRSKDMIFATVPCQLEGITSDWIIPETRYVLAFGLPYGEATADGTAIHHMNHLVLSSLSTVARLDTIRAVFEETRNMIRHHEFHHYMIHLQGVAESIDTDLQKLYDMWKELEQVRRQMAGAVDQAGLYRFDAAIHQQDAWCEDFVSWYERVQ